MKQISRLAAIILIGILVLGGCGSASSGSTAQKAGEAQSVKESTETQASEAQASETQAAEAQSSETQSSEAQTSQEQAAAENTAESEAESVKEDAEQAAQEEPAADENAGDEAEETGGSTEENDTEEASVLEDGIYIATFKTDSSMFHVNEVDKDQGTLIVKDGKMTMHIRLASKNIVNLYPGLAEDAKKEGAELLQPTVSVVTYPDGTTEEVYSFDVPVPSIGKEFDLALIGTKGKWYDHKVTVTNPEQK